MDFVLLKERITRCQATVGVIGLGYVGLPVACMFADAGFQVIGLDVKQDRVAQINKGQSPIQGKEPGLGELLARVVAEGRLRATTDYADLAQADVISINVQTPVDKEHKPRYVALEAACRSLGAVMKRGALVIVESTIAPGTMDHIVRPILEETSGLKVNEDFYLVACPERVMPGKLLTNLRTMNRVVGGSSPEATELAIAFYRHVVEADLDPADCITAELVKTAENAYRDVQIAFANEVALICEVAGANVWRVRELVNKCPYRDMHMPGAGVGGHCIPKDPWLLAQGARGQIPLRLIPAARAVNDAMPLHVADLVVDALQEAGRSLAEARVVILGYAYLEDSDDTRNTPTRPLLERLWELGVRPLVHDPYVPEYRSIPLEQAIRGADCLVLMVRHQPYLAMDLLQVRDWMRTPVLVDGRNAFPMAAEQGFIYRGVGWPVGKE
ncbi:MAG: nucleotide sugar dehydrogenase [Anaerolineae bacterium]|nr:nucleotide sugar dehydrogenase [Anaerolineae bacterium]